MISVFCGYVAPARADVDAIQITGETNPKIVELYQKLQDKRNEISNIESKRIDALTENANAMRENENRMENRILGATTTAATGLGTWAAASGLAETRADANALTAMRAYLATFQCEYGGGQTANYGPNDVALPGGNELTEYYNEYKSLAESLKETKAALGLSPGIESEPIIDRADTGLYQNAATGITTGAYASLARGILDPDGDDAARIAEQQNESSQKLKIGATALGAGVIGGIIGNYELNKDAPKELSEQINQEYDAQVESLNQETQNIETELNDAIAENAALVQEYNDQLQEHQNQVAAINNGPQNCRELFATYIEKISTMSPVKNTTDRVPDTDFPNIDDQKTLLAKCSGCADQGGIFDPQTLKCPCPPEKPDIIDGKCGVKPVVETPAPAAQQAVTEPPAEVDPPAETPEEVSPEEETAQPEADPNQCPATGNRLKSITDATKVGDFCSSAYIAVGKVKWYSKLVNGQKVCTCLASICTDGNHIEKGSCVKDVAEISACPRQEYKNISDIKTDEDALNFCETKGGKQCKTMGAVKDYNGVKGLIICNPTKEELGNEEQRAEDKKLRYYNCGDTRQIPDGIKCQYVSDFSGHKVIPLEADGLMKEYALKKYKDDIKCDEKSHRIQNDGNNYRQCASRKNDKQFYEFKFKDLDAGDKDYFSAICKIWGLDYGKSNDNMYYVCKKASAAQCNEISAAVKRTFFPGSGEAVLETTKKGSTNCIIKQHESAIGSRYQINAKATTLDQLKTTNGTDAMYFYDKNMQVNADRSLYTDIQTYLFNDLNLPVKPMQCSSGIIDNVMVIPMTKAEYEDVIAKRNKCTKENYAAMAGSTWGGSGVGGNNCTNKYPLPAEKMSDILACEYDEKRFDLAFKKLDVKWDKKSTGGYQGIRCLSNGGTFTGKTCGLASKKQCDEFKADFERQFQGSKGVEWDPDFGDNGGCILKDAKYAAKVQKVAETTGMVALTLVTAVAGGPIVWGLSALEATALVTEAKTESKLSDWSDKFVSDAAQCPDNDSTCANAVLKKHIARIIKGSKYFNETQGRAIAKQTTRLVRMLPKETFDSISDKVPDGIKLQNDKERDSVLENAILEYYGTKLTGGEKALLGAKTASTALTFATLVGGGVMAGLRQGVKHNLFTISKARQAKWLDLKILKAEDVGADVLAMSKTGQKAAAKAGTTVPATGKIDDIASGAGKSWEEELAEIGVKEEKTASGAVIYKDINTGKELSQDEVLRRIDNMPGKTATPKPKETTTPKDTNAPKANPPEVAPVTPQSRVYEKLGDKVKADIADIKSGKAKELHIPRGQLTDDEWKILKEDLAKDGLEITDGNMYNIVKKSGKADEVAQATSKADDAAKTTNKVDDAARGAENVATATEDFMKQAGLKKYNDIFVSEQMSEETANNVTTFLWARRDDLHFMVYNVDGTANGPKMVIAMSNEAATKQGLRWSGSDFVRAFNPQSSYNISKARSFISSHKPITEINGVPVYVKSFGKHSNRPIIKVEIAGRELPFYASSGSAGKLKIPTGKWEFFGGCTDSWFNKGSLDDIFNHYNSPELRKIAQALDDKIGDVRNVEYYMGTQARASLGGTGTVGGIDNISDISIRDINKGLRYEPGNATEYFDRNRDEVKEWLSQQRAVTPIPASSTGATAGRGAASGSNTAATGGKKVPFMTTRRAERKTVAQIKKDIAPGMPDGYFDATLKRFKQDGQSVIFDSSLTTDDGWELLNKSIKEENIQLVDDGFGNKVFNMAGDVPVKISGAEAKAANVVTLRSEASKSFDKYLAEVKTSPTGKGAKLQKSRLNDAGWDLVNESLARENVQLVDVVQDGEHYMQFRRADAVDDAASATRARASTTTKANDVDEVIELQLDDMFDAHNLRVSDGSGRLYVRNSAQEMLGFPVSADDAVSEVDQLYDIIRRGIDHPVNDAKVSKAISAMEHPSSSGVVYREPTSNYRWHMNGYQGAFSKHAEYHVSLNVDVDDNLIKKLNEIISKDKGQHIVYYKIPTAGSLHWKTMADPITIYLSKTSPEIERAIASVAKPYVRTSSEIGLLGRKIDDGVAIAYETSDLRTDIVSNIINQIARKDAGVAASLNGKYSVGSAEALRVWASDFLGYEIKPVIP